MPIHGYPGNVITANPTAPTSSVASGVWTTEQQLIAKAAGNWPFTIPTQQISRSLRFNSADTPSLSRTPGSAGNRQKFTISVWYKACGISTSQSNANIINAGGDGSSLVISGTAAFGATYDNRLLFREAGTTLFYWPMVFRDPSAWYHIVFAMDTTQATAANRAKLYVNGVDQGAFSGTAISQNTSTSINNTSAHSIGLFNGAYPNNLYYAEYYLIDGQQLTPSSFGQTNASTGVWEPIAYTGTYGTNGFYVNFSDNSGTTSTTLGKDYSGNGNNWTPNNFSVTAGAGNDSLVDSPTSYGTDTGAGGEVRGNYCTWNPLSTGRTLSNGNLDYAGSASGVAKGTVGVSSGKWYWEILANGANSSAGVASVSLNPTVSYCGSTADSWCLFTSGDRYNNGSATSGYSTFTTNDIISIALDMDNGKVYWAKNGVWQGSSNPATGTNAGYTNLSGYTITPANGNNNTNDLGTANFGQRPFAYTAPSGFKALCTQNLPTPTIGATSTTQANDYFDATTYSGSASSQSITNSGSMQPDFVWIKCRNTTDSHNLTDAVRGTNKNLFSNSTAAEDTVARLTSFNSNGFTLAGGYGNTNNAGQTYVAWQWRASNTTAVTNTAGTITSTVSASTTSGFSIVTYTGTGANATVGHGLGVTPGMIIIKSRSSGVFNWAVWHTSLGGGDNALQLNNTGATYTAFDYWNGNPTSTVFTLGTDSGSNQSSGTYVAYVFAPVAGYSAFGSYTGNGSTDGPFVYLGFRPRYIMQKRTDSTGTWELYDTARDTYNVMSADLAANLSDAETSFARFDSLSNGFKIRTTGAATNASGGTYIYACFAENPFKYSLAR